MDLIHDINWLAVAVAIVAGMAIGGVYFAPPVLGNVWTRAIGKTQDELRAANAGRMTGVWIATVVLTAVMAIIEAGFMAHLGIAGLGGGASVGFHLWLGFALPAIALNFLFEGRSVQSIAITAGHHLASLVVMGGIIGWWSGM